MTNAVELFSENSSAVEILNSTMEFFYASNSCGEADTNASSSSFLDQLWFPDWLAVVGTSLVVPVALLGCVLNLLVIWVLGCAVDRSAVDTIQLNVAVCDLAGGILGLGGTIATRIASRGADFYAAFSLDSLGILVNITFEDLSSMLIMGLRTRQVGTKDPRGWY